MKKSSKERGRSNPPFGLHGRVGLALGSGAARGWAHVGVLRGLEVHGIFPEIVCGSSIGAVVGAAYASNRLEGFERWVRNLDWRKVVSSFDVSFRGGLIKAKKVFEMMAKDLPDSAIEDLDRSFAAVATDLTTGHEVWLRTGSLHAALRASVALPGLITPARGADGRWLVDGGLVNPVPVSLCRALGADSVIAVDLNAGLVGRRRRTQRAQAASVREERSIQVLLQEMAAELRARFGRDEEENGPAADADDGEAMPSIYEVVTTSIHIMQVRITRSRMAGDPPEVLIAPRLDDFALFDFDRADEAIDIGLQAVAAAVASGA